MAERRILILDCTLKKEPSEGRLLKEFFQMCKLHKPVKGSSLYYKIDSKRDFLNKLNTGKKYDVSLERRIHGLNLQAHPVQTSNCRS
jgi:hypothetical protein